MGEDGPGPGAEGGARPLEGRPDVKPAPERLYGRARGHALRPRQRHLLDTALPRLAFQPDQAADPLSAFGAGVRALSLEVGSGGGEHALEQAVAHPGSGLIACEVYENGLCSLLARLVAEDGAEASATLPPNLRIWPDDGRALLRLLPDACLDQLFLLFPDPWPKARHAKRRFVHPDLLAVLARVLKPGAEWRVATDDPTYQAWIGAVMGAQPWFTASWPQPVRPAGWPPTRYEAKALRAGRSPLYWRFLRADGIRPGP